MTPINSQAFSVLFVLFIGAILIISAFFVGGIVYSLQEFPEKLVQSSCPALPCQPVACANVPTIIDDEDCQTDLTECSNGYEFKNFRLSNCEKDLEQSKTSLYSLRGTKKTLDLCISQRGKLEQDNLELENSINICYSQCGKGN